MSDHNNQGQVEYLSQFYAAGVEDFVHSRNNPQSILREE